MPIFKFNNGVCTAITGKGSKELQKYVGMWIDIIEFSLGLKFTKKVRE